MNGVITEIKEKKAVVLNKNGEFLIIPNDNYEIGQKITYRPMTNVYKQISTLAACFLLFVFMGFGGYYAYFTPVSEVSIDINPSIELKLNRFEKVINAKGINEDGEKVLQSLNIKHKNVETTIQSIVDTSKTMGYFKNTQEVLINVLDKDNKLEEKIKQATNFYQEQNISIIIEKATENDLSIAKEYGVSMGKAKIMKQYVDAFGGNMNDIKELPNDKIKNQLKTKGETPPPNSNDNSPVIENKKDNPSQSNNESQDKKDNPTKSNKDVEDKKDNPEKSNKVTEDKKENSPQANEKQTDEKKEKENPSKDSKTNNQDKKEPKNNKKN